MSIIATEEGMALPIALLVVMVIGILTAIFSKLTIENLNIVKQDEATIDTFEMAEGAVHDLLRQMVLNPHLWRTKVPLEELPHNYSQYSPASFSSTNGIPTCTGLACERNLYPTGGGLIKNFGPLSGEGESVDPNYSVSEQLNPENPPPSDITINDRAAWAQVERLDESLPGLESVGGDLSNYVPGGTDARVTRFRITGTALREVKGREGQSTVVVIVEIPNA